MAQSRGASIAVFPSLRLNQGFTEGGEHSDAHRLGTGYAPHRVEHAFDIWPETALQF